MLHQYLHADEEEDETTQKFGFEALADATAKVHAEEVADDAEEEGAETDGDKGAEQRGYGTIVHHGHRDTHGKGVDAGGEGLQQLGAQSAGVEVLLFFGFVGIDHHADAEEGKEGEGYPVVVGFDITGKVTGSQPSDERHQGLEEAEEHGCSDDHTPPHTSHDDTVHDRYRETIHGQSYGQQQDIGPVHHLFIP